MDTNNLFIKKYTESVKLKRLSSSSTAKYRISISSKLVSFISFLIFTSFIYVIFFGSYTSRINALGHISPNGDVINIYSDQAGIVTSIHIHPGDIIARGKPLLSIANNQLIRNTSPYQQHKNLITTRIELIHKKIDMAKLNFSRRKENIKNEIKFYTRALESIREIINASNEKKEISKENISRLEKLFKKKSVSKIQFQDGQLNFLDSFIINRQFLQQENELELKIFELNSKMKDLKITLDEIIITLQESLSTESQELITLEESWKRDVISPIDGYIGAVNISQGQSISHQQLLMTLVPNIKPLEATLYVTNKAIGFVKKGAAVKLKLDPFPYQKFGYIEGKIASISNTSIPASELKNSLSREPTYIVKVKLDKQKIDIYGESVDIKPSTTLNADISIDRRYIYEWILEPLLTLKGTI
ncbi:HlyD family secretion protein [Aeromonas media]|uniref:HlyD family secretion protein n=1 Tax=Aeromonas media TaxID=651 RepID=UPI00143DFE38|nr:HlyD family efflux transporter periplasmic adaptor subunit [Aeromonas media]MBS4698890.1 HlyD family efflux transporter periplasmic adaptor subunit [Aeromonas media]QIY86977.1 HlyD family efflux transporter periplasmic adaptor subunit [Aeromonas hydrophila]